MNAFQGYSPGMADVVEFVGGMRWRSWNATRPLVRLRVSPDGVTASPRFDQLPFTREVTLAWSEIRVVERVRGVIPFIGNGIGFWSDRGRLIFWASPEDSQKIADLARQQLGSRVRGGRRFVL
jgi:hypothetical protein